MDYAKEIYINNKRISLADPTIFIADIAANHDGDIVRAKELIFMAAESGADVAKFQHFVAEKIVSNYGFQNLKERASHQSSWKKSVFDVYKQYECKVEWTEQLAATAREANIEFMTTPYDYETLTFIDNYVNAYKIGSGDITWIQFIKDIARFNKPVFLACGASTLEDTKRAVAAVQEFNCRLVLMQCNTNYTADCANLKYINLNVLGTFKQEFPAILLGLSDHTLGHTSVLGAVALGARVVEKHFTDCNSRVGPDHKFALTPASWKEMISLVRELECALGDGVKRVESNEEQTVVIQRRCIRLKHSLRAGSILAETDIDFLRPAPLDSMPPYLLDAVLNKKIATDKVQGDYLCLEDLGLIHK